MTGKAELKEEKKAGKKDSLKSMWILTIHMCVYILTELILKDNVETA